MQVARVCTRVEDGLMPIVPVSLPDSEAPPPDESVGPIPVGPHSPAPWGHMHCGDKCGATCTVGQPIPGPTLLMPSYHTLESHTAILFFSAL